MPCAQEGHCVRTLTWTAADSRRYDRCNAMACPGVRARRVRRGVRLDTVPTVEPDAPPILRPDAPAGVCGIVGTDCCTTGMACTDGSQCLTVSGRSRCAELAGAFEQPTSTTCANTPSCEEDNPFVNTPCTCPNGFASQELTIDDGCGSDTNPANSLAKITSCAPATAPPNTDWGGWFLQGDLVQCVPGNPPDGCMTKNAVTNACSCPGTTQPVKLRVFVPGTACANGFLGGTLSMCLDPNVAVASIRGVFEIDPDGNCRVPITGYGCRCPAGSVESKLHTVTDRVVNTNTGAVVFYRSTITMCLATP